MEKNNTVTNLASSNSGNKGGSYLAQSVAQRSSSHNNGIGQSTADTVKASE